MLEVRGIENGLVLDHITAGKGLVVFNKLVNNKLSHPVVLLMNVDSGKLGKKDIIKIENTFNVDLNVLGLIDENITVCKIENGRLVDKTSVKLPSELKGYIKCKNPRCITNFDDYAEPHFKLVDAETLEYECSYCEEITKYE